MTGGLTCFCVCQSELVAELFQQQENVPSVANGSVRPGKRATREHKLTVGFQVSCFMLSLVNIIEQICFVLITFCYDGLHLCLLVPSVLTDANGHAKQHHSSLCPLH